MNASECPKCGQSLEDGRITATDSAVAFASTQQGENAMFRTRVQTGKACLNCGYVEFYLDPQELKNNIAQDLKHKKK